MRVICDCGELGSFPAFSSQTITYTKEVERPSDAARRISAALQNRDRRGLGYLVGAELAAISQSANLLDSHWISSECSATANCGHRHHATTLACAVDNAPTHSPSLVAKVAPSSSADSSSLRAGVAQVSTSGRRKKDSVIKSVMKRPRQRDRETERHRDLL